MTDLEIEKIVDSCTLAAAIKRIANEPVQAQIFDNAAKAIVQLMQENKELRRASND